MRRSRKINSNRTWVVVVCALSVLGVLIIFCGAGMPCTSTAKHEHSICLPIEVYVPYINCKSWMIHTSPVKHGWSVSLMYENYVNGNLLED